MSLLNLSAGDNLHYLLAAQYGRDPSFYMMVAAAVMIPTVGPALSFRALATPLPTGAIVHATQHVCTVEC